MSPARRKELEHFATTLTSDKATLVKEALRTLAECEIAAARAYTEGRIDGLREAFAQALVTIEHHRATCRSIYFDQGAMIAEQIENSIVELAARWLSAAKSVTQPPQKGVSDGDKK
jgi:hypothetical protein